ncbi:rab-GTPase-TBC domain-containing protein [Xylariomycetidae sp. FL2044]|nr:rab-GTPase-TBC domain-containing protein [Xylariomycetidae sp. FL2044]
MGSERERGAGDGISAPPPVGTEDEPEKQQPQARILDACRRRDIDLLREIAISPGGFLSDANRCQAWPVLLGFDAEDTDEAAKESESWRHMERHRDEDQVKLDVDRSFVYYPNDDSDEALSDKKRELSDLITEVLRRHPFLCYFQGYHDICQVLLLVLPATGSQRALAVSRLSVLRIRDFMLPTLVPAVSQLRLIPAILAAADPELRAHLARVVEEPPYFALSDTLTMFAHNIPSYGAIARLFDALLARDPAFGLYVFAAIVLRRRGELLQHDPADADVLHFTLSKLPVDLDLDAAVRDAAQLYAERPPESLGPPWRAISASSALRTARDVRACSRQSLADGERYFASQLSELRWAERRRVLARKAWSNRAVLLALVVGAGAIYLRKTWVWNSIFSISWLRHFGR